jgi:WD40 repeat protein
MLWDVAAQQSHRGHRLLPTAVQFATEAAPGTALSFNLTDSQPSILQLNDLTQTAIQFNSFSADQFAFFSEPNIIGVHDRTNSLQIYQVQSRVPQLLGELMVGANIAPGGMAYCREKRLLAWRDGSNAVRIASLDKPAQRVDLNSDLNEPLPLDFSSDGRLLVIGSSRATGGNRNLEIREVDSGTMVANLDVRRARPLMLFANKGRTFVTLSAATPENEVVFCDVTRPGAKSVRFPERGALVGLRASPDGRWVVMCSQDGFVVLYDAQTMERKKVLHGHMQGVHGVRFSPDGKSLVSTSGAREAVKIWHVETGQELLTLSGKGSLLSHVEFVDNGNALLAGGAGQTGTWQIWRAPSWAQIEAAEKGKSVESSR